MESQAINSLVTCNSESKPEEVLIQVDGLSKRFCRDLKTSLYYGILDIGREILGYAPRAEGLRRSEFWALREVQFQVHRGDAVGLMGKNGSGKTTLMRMLSGLIKPSLGRIQVKGRLAPLLALGAGFNPILTGRENVYVNMSILGLDRQEIDANFESVVEFAEMAYALDAPVQNYSSGMIARLGFACAVYTRPDILLVDEVMAVGDLQFRRKCQDKLMQLREEGTTFLLVNHSPSLIVALCNRALYLKDGIQVADGEAGAVVDAYERDIALAFDAEDRVERWKEDESNVEGLERSGHGGPAKRVEGMSWSGAMESEEALNRVSYSNPEAVVTIAALQFLPCLRDHLESQRNLEDAQKMEGEGRAQQEIQPVEGQDLISGEQASLRFVLEIAQPQSAVHVLLQIYQQPGESSEWIEKKVLQIASAQDQVQLLKEPGRQGVEVFFDPLILAPGVYRVHLECLDEARNCLTKASLKKVWVKPKLAHQRYPGWHQPHHWKLHGHSSGLWLAESE